MEETTVENNKEVNVIEKFGHEIQDNFLIIREDKDEKKESTSKIQLIELNKKPPSTGVVVGAGPGTYQNGIFVENKIKVGDKVLYSNRVCVMNIEGEDFLVTKPYDIVSVKR